MRCNKVSVILPVYNVETYLRQCLDSVIGQTLQEIEVICIDDGSQDSSGEILDEYQRRDSRLRVVHQANEGAGAARNRGIEMATGEFVAFMDPDDYYPDTQVLSELYRAAKEHGVLVAGGSLGEVRRGQLFFDFQDDLRDYVFERDGLTDYWDFQFDFGWIRFIYSRELLEEKHLRFPSYRQFEDPPFYVRTMMAAGRFYQMKRCSYCYRCGHKSVEWTAARAVDLLRGITDDLNLSKEARLAKLHSLSVRRIEETFYPALQEVIARGEHQCLDVLGALLQANACVDPQLLEHEGTQAPDGYLLRPLAELLDRLRTTPDAVLRAEYEAVKRSWSFRLGRALTAPARKLRGGIRCLRENGLGYTLEHMGVKWKALVDRSGRTASDDTVNRP